MDFSYKFSAVKGCQANKDFYIAMVPLKYLEKLFPVDEVVMPEYRAQRKLNLSRIPEMSDYILENRNTYVFSALAGSIDGDFHFSSISNTNSGILEIDMVAKVLINDGQHRKAAILEALKEDLTLSDETISIVFYQDKGLVRSQQMFSDLNKHAVKPSNSLSALYDIRDRFSSIARFVVDNNVFFKKYTEMESDSLGVNSPKYFTLNHVKNATEIIFKKSEPSEIDEDFALKYWSKVAENITEWELVEKKEITKKYLKENYIITLSVTLKALGRLGLYYYTMNNGFKNIEKLKDIDWLRSNKQWVLRTIRTDGKVMSNEQAVMLTCNKIKTLLGIKLNVEEINRERQIRK